MAEVSTPLLPETADVGAWLTAAHQPAVDALLSSGERVLVGLVHAVWNGGGTARFADLARLSPRLQRLVCDVWVRTYASKDGA